MDPRELRRRIAPNRTLLAAIAVLLGTLAGGACHLLGAPRAGDAIWTVTLLATIVPLAWTVVRALARGDLGVDVIALLAMAGALAGGELLAGSVVAVMLTGGNALEAYADGRARRELTALLRRAPRIAHRRDAAGRWAEVAVDAVVPGDVVLVRTGELVPVDGTLLSERAAIDASAVTGESLPVAQRRGDALRSGTANAGEPFELKATRDAARSSYAALVRLVEQAQAEKPPFTRMADRYAGIFLPVTLALAGAAWAISGEAIRALAVLVVATPCPLILAAPIALVAGLSRASSAGIVMKGGTALERLGATRTVLLDKTGTLTRGRPAVERIVLFDGRAGDGGESGADGPGGRTAAGGGEAGGDGAGELRLLQLAASVDQLSAHVLAEGLVGDARRRGLTLEEATAPREAPGDGIVADVGGHRVGVGGEAWLERQGFTGDGAATVAELGAAPGRALVHVGVDGRLAGVLVMADRLRPDAARLVAALHDAGVGRVAMVTGDRAEVAEAVAEEAGLDRVFAEQSPERKLAIVRAARERPELRPVVMVGDGVNDAPALALADVGIALAGESRTVTSDAADAVITVDRVDRVAAAVRIGRRTMAIARQSVVAGMAMSVAAMVVAALGHLPPVAGALLQEAIDVAVILNALRALRP
ncbi:heavy metal translocating P-type ATPase [Conexibacter arvalis]|uniref:Heavy metal translocating P-type ATPase n=1 Tax=Conexibacter arvalis TaxID=912552 RepID=A0A840ILP6_9ACTN|nr:heavy metal translocating P-type ATPase [Conexibacter arvalis]MBB4664904.1 heavy metal translocating P-type ATPase [Conexibacter arvalis]